VAAASPAGTALAAVLWVPAGRELGGGLSNHERRLKKSYPQSPALKTALCGVWFSLELCPAMRRGHGEREAAAFVGEEAVPASGWVVLTAVGGLRNGALGVTRSHWPLG